MRLAGSGWIGRGLATMMAALLLAATMAAQAQADATGRARAEVEAAERAFARTMADRDLAAFGRFLSDQAVFFGDDRVSRGRLEVIAAWAVYFRAPQAPFSWEPDRVEVLDDGTLALSTGPVRDVAGRVVARFNTLWRKEGPGQWRVVFDKGQPPDPPAVPSR
jgi:ketosteroid isomerase-like protein